jgi:hypothetical protein
MSIKVRVSYERYRLVIDSECMHLYSADLRRALAYRSLVWGKEKGVCFVAHFYLPLVLKILNKHFKAGEIYVSRDIPDVETIEGFLWSKKAVGNLTGKGGETDMPLIAKAPERRLCPMGAHKAKVEKIEPKHHEQSGERVLFTFMLDGRAWDDGMPIRVFTEASNTLTRKSKLRKIVEGILGRKLTKAEVQGFDLETLVGLECQIVVKHEEGLDGNTYSRVETVISL